MPGMRKLCSEARAILECTEGWKICTIFTMGRSCSSTVLGVVILSVCLSVRMSVTRLLCGKTEQCTADTINYSHCCWVIQSMSAVQVSMWVRTTVILRYSIPHEKAITLVWWHQLAFAVAAAPATKQRHSICSPRIGSRRCRRPVQSSWT